MCNTVSSHMHCALILTLSGTTQMGYLSRSLEQHVFIVLLKPLQHPGFKIWEQNTQCHQTGSSVSGTPAYRHASGTAQFFAVYKPFGQQWPTNGIIRLLLPSGLRKSMFFSTQTLLFIHSWSNPNLTQVIERLLWSSEPKKGKQS